MNLTIILKLTARLNNTLIRVLWRTSKALHLLWVWQHHLLEAEE